MGLILPNRNSEHALRHPTMTLIACRKALRRITAVALTACLAAPVFACGPDSDCTVGDRTYRLYLPRAAAAGPVGALVFAHGYKGTAANEMRNTGLRHLADDLGLALIALQADGDDWAIPHAPQAPDRTEVLEYGYVDAVLADAATRAEIDPARRVAAGFSAGGMMVWTLACGASDRFRGFVAMSGTFWAPVPQDCPAPPANLVHIHGTADPMVPMEGRSIAETSQGDVNAALAMYTSYGDFTPDGDATAAPGGMTCRSAHNPAGKLLAFCTFDGGHDFSADRLRFGIAQVLAAP